MISQTSEYALRTILYLATQQGRPATTRQIARAAGIPPSYLCKILQSLSRAGLIHSQRGLHGGSTLRRDPNSITVYDVVLAIDHVPRVKTCPLSPAVHGIDLCPLHRWLNETLTLVERILRQASIADLLGKMPTVCVKD